MSGPGQAALKHYRRVADLGQQLVLIVVDAAFLVRLVLHLALDALDLLEAAAGQSLDLDEQLRAAQVGLNVFNAAQTAERGGARYWSAAT